MRNIAVLLSIIASSLSFASPAWAQTAPAGSEAAQCAYFKPLGTSFLSQFEDLVLKPGGKIDMAAIARDPSLAQAIQQITAQQSARKTLDWAGLCYYKAANDAQRAKAPPRVIFLGDSITENWIQGDPALFSGTVIDRGISGQTTSQILLRFYSDVVALHPAVVHLMAGTNDIAQNEGPISDVDIVNNIRAMIDLAMANHIKVVLASIPPMAKLSWRPDIAPAARVAALNDRLRRLATERGVVFVDYYAAMKDDAGGIRAELSNDGVHPNRDGYAVMRPLTDSAIAQVMR